MQERLISRDLPLGWIDSDTLVTGQGVGAQREGLLPGEGGGAVAASGQGRGPSGMGAVLQHPSRWAGDSNHRWPRVRDRQVSVLGQGRSVGKQRLKNPGALGTLTDSRPVARWVTQTQQQDCFLTKEVLERV